MVDMSHNNEQRHRGMPLKALLLFAIPITLCRVCLHRFAWKRETGLQRFPYVDVSVQLLEKYVPADKITKVVKIIKGKVERLLESRCKNSCNQIILIFVRHRWNQNPSDCIDVSSFFEIKFIPNSSNTRLYPVIAEEKTWNFSTRSHHELALGSYAWSPVIHTV